MRLIRGVGGVESVFVKVISRVEVDGVVLEEFEIEIGSGDYGAEMGGILGMNWLMEVGAVIDLPALGLRTGA